MLTHMYLVCLYVQYVSVLWRLCTGEKPETCHFEEQINEIIKQLSLAAAQHVSAYIIFLGVKIGSSPTVSAISFRTHVKARPGPDTEGHTTAVLMFTS